jgi:LuxR family transcriptional regulator, maltose regulon positive regulatory protein
MSIRNLIILSQLNPPAKRSRILERERVNDQLKRSDNYPLTILEAGTGYGKSTSVVSFINSLQKPIYWFTISGTDRDPKLFLAKLFTAFNQKGTPLGEEALRFLDMQDSTPNEALIVFINTLSTQVKEENFFILDDFHRVCDIAEVMGYVEWIIEHLPSQLHMIIATRFSPDFPMMTKWRIKGEVLEITRDVLSFTGEEIALLFDQQYGITLSDNEIVQLLEKTEGWAIGLQMVWQTLQNNPDLSIHQVLEEERHSKSTLFDYLAEEVLVGLAPDLQNFLLKTSILSKLESASCDFLLTIEDSDKILRHLNHSGLFIEELRPGVFRYHQMFREFLLSRIQQDTSQMLALHFKIASYYRAHEYWEEAIFHLLSAGDYQQVNRVLEEIGKNFIRDGRHESINYWIHEIPKDIRNRYPYLVYLLGEVNRYLGNFEDALEYYHTAERLYRHVQNKLGISRALRGQGQVFLDTIRPNNGDRLLQEALRLLDPVEMREEVADLLVLIAENQLNLGDPDNAERLLSQARQLMPDLEMETDFIQARVFLRTGRFTKGLNLLLEREANNPSMPIARPQRFHRESTLLLALFYAFIGDQKNAEKFARQGINLGVLMGSKFVQSVGFMRLGHALLLRDQNPISKGGIDTAKDYFRESIEKIDIVRIHVEPLWGLCRALGYEGRFIEAEELALESLEIAKKAGDEWISILIQLSLGAGAVLVGNYEAAQQFLTSAETSAIRVKDPFTLCTARMWLSLKAWFQGYQNTAFSYLEKCITLVKEYDYGFLLNKGSLLGLKDPEIIYPLMNAAYQNQIETEFIGGQMRMRGIHQSRYHPGYTLWVKTLGGFKVWRGDWLIDTQDWKREKARQFFQLLLNQRDKWLHKEKISEMLWPGAPLEKTTNYIKVVYNTINQALEPDRPRNKTAFFVERTQELYRLNPVARIIVDVDIFMEFVNEGSIDALENALELYQGQYFADNDIQEWLMIEVQYYHQQFLLAADKLINHLIEFGDFEKALDITYQILNEDVSSEVAYRAQMLIFHKMGLDSMVHEVFQRCEVVIEELLNSPVSHETERLYTQLIS